MKRLIGVTAAVALLAGCGGNRQELAVTACEKAVAERVTGRTFELDRADMLAKAQAQGENGMQVNSTVVFDKGLPAESRQTFECRVQFDPENAGAEPSVTGLQFTW